MTLEIEIQLPAMEIDTVRTHFPSHPQPSCVDIIDHYDKLVGLSIARGFTHKVRELFGGPRGCSHTTALLQAMAPIAMQSQKGMEVQTASNEGKPNPFTDRNANKSDSWRRLVNTCHVWAEDGQKVEILSTGGDTSGMTPLTMQKRLDELGLSQPED